MVGIFIAQRFRKIRAETGFFPGRISTSSSRWLGNAGEGVIDENRFHNCVSTFSFSVNKRMWYHCRSWKLEWIEQHSKHIFNSTILFTFAWIQLAREWWGARRRLYSSAKIHHSCPLKQQCVTQEMHITVMTRHEILFKFNWIFNPCPMSLNQGHPTTI